MKEVPLKDPVDYEFDVSPDGKFVRIAYYNFINSLVFLI